MPRNGSFVALTNPSRSPSPVTDNTEITKIRYARHLAFDPHLEVSRSPPKSCFFRRRPLLSPSIIINSTRRRAERQQPTSRPPRFLSFYCTGVFYRELLSSMQNDTGSPNPRRRRLSDESRRDGSGGGRDESSRKRKRRILSCDTCRRQKCRCELDEESEACSRCRSLRYALLLSLSS